ncbi:MAG: hypothetical protein ACRDCE_21365 [Cetobacterium sp.]|uniref:hypothetical protein n=1 Tax=Cetobacterium sp. TaxID=2071632 RepID=UPI003EE6BCD8
MHLIFLKAFKSLITKLILSAASQSFVEWLFFKIAKVLVKMTKNTLDDEALERIEKEYFKQ